MQLPNLISKVFGATSGGSNSGGGTTINIPNPLCGGSTNCTIVAILEQISIYLLWIGAPIATIMIIYGAFQILTAAGDPTKVKTGSKTILYAAIGYGVILISWGVISLVKELLGATG